MLTWVQTTQRQECVSCNAAHLALTRGPGPQKHVIQRHTSCGSQLRCYERRAPTAVIGV